MTRRKQALNEAARVTGTSQVYAFDMTLDAEGQDTLQGVSTGSLTIVWEARNH